MYSLQQEIIREIVAGVLGKKVHFNVQASGDADAAWDQYMRKNQSANTLRTDGRQSFDPPGAG